MGRYLVSLIRSTAHLRGRKYGVVHAMLPVRRCDLYHPHAGIAAEAVETVTRKHAGPLRETGPLANRLNRKAPTVRRRRARATEWQGTRRSCFVCPNT